VIVFLGKPNQNYSCESNPKGYTKTLFHTTNYLPWTISDRD